MYEGLRRVILGAVVLSGLALGCGAVVPGSGGGGDGGALDGSVAPDTGGARVCTRSTDCDPGMECLGPPGCAIPWTCNPALGRPCSADNAPFCGCDGQTFYGSSTCPSQPYARTGTCETPVPDAGVDVPLPGPRDCRLPSGQVCRDGTTCPAGDGCNACACNRGILSCTGVVCEDAGPGPGPRDCRLPDGRVCPDGTSCPAGDGCNTCTCRAGMLGCTLIGCVDAGPGPGPGRPCANSSQCTPGELCQGPAGCGMRWTCGPSPGCTRDAVPYCGCDGQTFLASSTCPGQPYTHRGDCGIVPPDAGPQGCRLRDGNICPYGTTCWIDRCTYCGCTPDGGLRCAINPQCSGPDAGVDAGPPPDVGPTACRLPNGETCPRYGRCRVDSCTICYCTGEGATECSTDGNCAADGGSSTPCAAQDAAGRGFCDLFLGYRWTGTTCEPLSGCSCEGTACRNLFMSPEACRTGYRHCATILPVDAGF